MSGQEGDHDKHASSQSHGKKLASTARVTSSLKATTSSSFVRNSPVWKKASQVKESAQLWQLTLEAMVLQTWERKVKPYLTVITVFYEEQLIGAFFRLPPIQWMGNRIGMAGEAVAQHMTPMRKSLLGVAAFGSLVAVGTYASTLKRAGGLNSSSERRRRYHHERAILDYLDKYEELAFNTWCLAAGRKIPATKAGVKQPIETVEEEGESEEGMDGTNVSGSGSSSSRDSTNESGSGSSGEEDEEDETVAPLSDADDEDEDDDDGGEGKNISTGESKRMLSQMSECISIARRLNCRESLIARLRLVLQRLLIADIIHAHKGVNAEKYQFSLVSSVLDTISSLDSICLEDLFAAKTKAEEEVLLPHLDLLLQLRDHARREGRAFLLRRLLGRPETGVNLSPNSPLAKPRSWSRQMRLFLIVGLHTGLFMGNALLLPSNPVGNDREEVIDQQLPIRQFIFTIFKTIQSPLNHFLSGCLKSYVECELRRDLYTKVAAADQWVTDVVGSKQMQIYATDVDTRMSRFRSETSQLVRPLAFVIMWGLHLRHAYTRGLMNWFWLVFAVDGIPTLLFVSYSSDDYTWEIQRLDEAGGFSGLHKDVGFGAEREQNSHRSRRTKKCEFRGLTLLAAAASSKTADARGSERRHCPNLAQVAAITIGQSPTLPSLFNCKFSKDSPHQVELLGSELISFLKSHSAFLNLEAEKILRTGGREASSMIKGGTSLYRVYKAITNQKTRHRLKWVFTLGTTRSSSMDLDHPKCSYSDLALDTKALYDSVVADAVDFSTLVDSLQMRLDSMVANLSEQSSAVEEGGGDGSSGSHNNNNNNNNTTLTGASEQDILGYDRILDPEERPLANHSHLLTYNALWDFFDATNFSRLRALGLEVLHAHKMIGSSSAKVKSAFRDQIKQGTGEMMESELQRDLYRLITIFSIINIYCKLNSEQFSPSSQLFNNLTNLEQKALIEKGPAQWLALLTGMYRTPLVVLEDVWLDRRFKALGDAYFLEEILKKMPSSIDDAAAAASTEITKRFHPAEFFVQRGGDEKAEEAVIAEIKRRQIANLRRLGEISAPSSFSTTAGPGGVAVFNKEEEEELLKEEPPLIQFRNVSFQYPKTPNTNTLKQVSFSIPNRGLVGIVGETGSGKSTLFKLMLKMYECRPPVTGTTNTSASAAPTHESSNAPSAATPSAPSEEVLEVLTPEKLISRGGQIELDGIPYNDLSTTYIRHTIAVVGQKPFIMAGSNVLENLVFGIVPRPSLKEVVKVCSRVKLHSVIMERDLGYQASIDSDEDFSGGEMQRLALARALLRDPEVLLVDEATSALDAKTEAEIMALLEDFASAPGRTVVSIAHRLSTLKNASYIIAMKDGECVQEGAPEDLLQQPDSESNVYKRYLTKQRLREKEEQQDAQEEDEEEEEHEEGEEQEEDEEVNAREEDSEAKDDTSSKAGANEEEEEETASESKDLEDDSDNIAEETQEENEDENSSSRGEQSEPQEKEDAEEEEVKSEHDEHVIVQLSPDQATCVALLLKEKKTSSTIKNKTSSSSAAETNRETTIEERFLAMLQEAYNAAREVEEDKEGDEDCSSTGSVEFEEMESKAKQKGNDDGNDEEDSSEDSELFFHVGEARAHSAGPDYVGGQVYHREDSDDFDTI